MRWGALVLLMCCCDGGALSPIKLGFNQKCRNAYFQYDAGRKAVDTMCPRIQYTQACYEIEMTLSQLVADRPDCFR